MNFNSQYLPKADVVFTVMFLNKTLCEKTLYAILGENIELEQLAVESKNELHKAALNSVYFDVKTQARDGRIITLDLQRKYIKKRVRNRTVYYACREIGTQPVEKSKYENLQNVIVTFLLTEASLKSTGDNKKIQLHDNFTGEIYSDLLTIHEVNIKHITSKNKLELQILRHFFEIETQNAFDKFSTEYGDHEYGKLLLSSYCSAISDISLLDNLREEDKFMFKLSEEERLEERQEGRQEGRLEGRLEGRQEGRLEERIQVAKSMLKKGFSIDDIVDVTGLSTEEIQQL